MVLRSGGGGSVDIRITASDGASAVFRKIGGSAKDLGTDLDGVGGKAGAFDDLTEASNGTATSFSTMASKGSLVVGAVAAVGAAIVGASREAAEHERLVNAINTAYGDTADEILAFANELEGKTIFSDEDILAGQRFFATLQNNYDLTPDELREVMSLTADLATVAGYSYEDAANRVAAAIRGEAEAAEQLGLTLNQQTIDREGITLSMTNQEAAQFRLNALIEQASVYQGAAQEATEGTQGAFAELSNVTQDLVVNLGNLVNPLLVPLVQTLADIVGVADTAVDGLGYFFDTLAPGSEAVESYNDALEQTEERIRAMNEAGEEVRADQLESIIGQADELIHVLDEAEDGALTFYDALNLEGKVDPAQFSNTLISQYQEAIEAFPELQAKIEAAINNPDIDSTAYVRALEDIFSEVEITAEGSNINEVLNEAFSLDPNRFSYETQAMLAQYGGMIDSMTVMAGQAEQEQQEAVRRTERVRAEAFAAEQERLEEHRQAEADHNAAVIALQEERYNDERDRREERRRQEIAEHEERVQRARDFIQAGRGLGGFDDPLSTINMTGFATDATRMAEAVGVANTALENTFRIVVENTNAIAQTTQATEDWILSLASAEEGISRLEQARNASLITEEQYRQALGAQRDIATANRQVQEDIVAIQAMQAPLVAELTMQQAAYVEQLRLMPAEQQAVALGWMDVNTAAQANEAIMVAATAANGEWGASGQQAATQFIEGAIAANPILETMLTNIGLVARDHEGNLIINFDSASEGMSEIERLTQSIDALIVTLGGIPPLDIDTSDAGVAVASIQMVNDALSLIDGKTPQVTPFVDNGQALSALSAVDAMAAGLDGVTATVFANGNNANAIGAIGAAAGALAGLNGDTATVYINAVNNAGAAIGAVASALAGLDGRTATTYIRTVDLGTTGGAVGGLFANGGTVWGDAAPSPWGMAPQAANGRTVMVGEAGPELVSLPHGSQVMPHAASMSRLDAAGGGGVEHHYHFHAPVYGMDDLAAQLAGPLFSNLASEYHRRSVALGVNA